MYLKRTYISFKSVLSIQIHRYWFFFTAFIIIEVFTDVCVRRWIECFYNTFTLFWHTHNQIFNTNKHAHTLTMPNVHVYMHGTLAYEQCGSIYCDNGQHTSKRMGKKKKEIKKNVSIHSCVCTVYYLCSPTATTKKSKCSMYNASGLADVDVYNNCLFYLRIST